MQSNWLLPLIFGCITIVFAFVLNKLTTKSNAQMTGDIAQLKKDVWTTEQKITLETRLTRFETILAELRSEVDFTRTSHTEFLRLLEKALIPVAHSPHTPDLDRLLDKRDRGEELSAMEWKELIERLGEQAKEYGEVPGKQVSLLGLRAIYLSQLRQAQKRENQLVKKRSGG